MRPDDGRGRRRPAPIWEQPDDAGDPSLFVLHAPGDAAAPDASVHVPDDARHRALLRSGFRSQVESLLMASLGRLREAGGETASDLTGAGVKADKLVDDALTEAASTFVDIGRDTIADTRGELQSMMRQIRGQGLERRAALQREAALAALEGEADDLVARVANDPDRYESYREMLGIAAGRFAEGLDEAEIEAFLSNVRDELDVARVQGLIGHGRVDEARAAVEVLAARLPDETIARLNRDADAAEREQLQRAVGNRAMLLAELQAAIASGADVSEQVAEAAADGRLMAPQLQVLSRAQEEASTRASAIAAVYGRVEQALDSALRLDPGEARDRQAVDFFWRQQLAPSLEELEPPKRFDIENGAVATLGVVPRDILTRTAEGLASVRADIAVLAARQIVAILALRPDLIDQFPPHMVSVADLIWQAHEGGASPEIAVAFGRSLEQDVPPTNPRVNETVATAAGTKLAGWSVTGLPRPTSNVRIGMAQRMPTVMQAPGGPIDRHIDRLAIHPDGGDARPPCICAGSTHPTIGSIRSFRTNKGCARSNVSRTTRSRGSGESSADHGPDDARSRVNPSP